MKSRLLVGTVISLFSSICMADIGTGPTMSATVESTCTISSQDVNFGELDFIRKNSVFKLGSFANVRCSLGTTYKMRVDADATKKRLLKSTTTNTPIEYRFYKAGTEVLLGADGANDFIEGVGNGLYQRIDFDVSINPNQQIKPGYYTDRATVYLTY